MYDALKLAGQVMTPNEIMEIVRKDRAYYNNSGGGFTLSGGEPLLDPEFCAELFAMGQAEGIHTALDTAANVPYEFFTMVLPYTNAIMLDLKIMDRKLHQMYTGSPNDQILENARRLFSEQIDLYIRIPLVAGINDTKENIMATAQFLQKASNLKEIKLLSYHSLGIDKAKSIGLSQETFVPPKEDSLGQIAEYFSMPVVW